MKFKLGPLHQFTLFLAALSLGAIAFNWRAEVFIHFGVTLGATLALYYGLKALTKKKKNVWNAVITGLILFLLLHPGEPVYALIAVSAAMLLKYFMNYKGSPVVNPAVFGLLVAVGVGHWLPNMDSAFVSWWGTAYSPYYVSLIIVGAWIILGLNKWRKLPIFLSFMVVHVLLLTLRGMGMDFIWYTLTDSTIYFLAAAMLTEPKTSPLRYQQQAQFGAVGAIAYNILMHYSAPYFALWAIVFANAANLLFKPKKRKKKLVARATAAEE